MPLSVRDIARRTNKRLWKRGVDAARRPARLDVTRLEERAVPDVSGTIFRDNNFDGAFTTANDHGFYEGVTVTAYDSVGGQKAVSTGTGGTYSIPTAGLTGPFRIEVTVPSGFAPGPIGVDNPSSVRFTANANATGIDFGIVNPTNYSQADPNLFVANMSYAASNGANKANGAILSFPYTNNGLSVGTYKGINGKIYSQQPVPTDLATFGQVGSIYGLARQQSSNTIFAGAFVRRYVGVGLLGTGMVYAVDGAGTQTVNPLVNFNDLGNPIYAGMLSGTDTPADFLTGTDPRLANPAFNYLTDVASLPLTHRIGLGDMEISPDGRTLYTVNLNARELIEIPIAATGTLDTTRQFRRSPVPLTVGNDALNFNNPGDVRPFALAFKDGVLFVGSTYTAETTGTASTLRSYVYAYDTAARLFRGYDQRTNAFAATLAPAMTADLSYARINGTVAGTTIYDVLDNATPPGSYNTGNASERGRVDTFRPWDNTHNTFRDQQPLLSDIVFDRNVMVLGVRDRHGDQIGWNVPGQPNGAGEGAILRAHPDGAGSYILESGGTSNGVTNSIGGAGSGAAKLNPQGPGGARFYWSDYLWGSDGANNFGFGHANLAMGGLYQLPGGTKITTTTIDPVRYSSGGIGWFDNTTGARPQGFEIYDSQASEFGKAYGLGDLEAFENPAPVEIGNRVWLDTDNDGIQDPGEASIAGVDVQLVEFATGNVLKTATTDVNGNYLFSGFAGTSTKSALYGLTLGTNTKYVLRVRDTSGAGQQAALAGLKSTKALADPTANGVLRDSDFATSGANADVVIVTGGPGSIDHSFDAGFTPAPVTVDLGDLVFYDVNNDGIFNGADTGLKGVPVTLYKDNNGDGLIDAGDTKIGTLDTDAGGNYLFAALATGKYIVAIAAPAGFFTSTGANGNPNAGPFEPGKSGTENSQDHGTLVGAAIQTKSVDLLSSGNPDGTQNLRQDFGLFRPYSLGNRVWLDANNSGTIDGAEAGIDGATVRLVQDLNANGTFDAATETIQTQKTAGGGYYRFDFLSPGKYVVAVDRASVPLAGLRSSTGSVFPTGTYEPAPVPGGNVDSDDNGTTVGTFVRTGIVTLGNANGGDTETIAETDLGPGDPGATNARSNLTVDFGFFRPMSLGNRVFLDANNNGAFDAGDTNGPANVGVNLLDSAGNPVLNTIGNAISTVTDANGYYLFTGLNPGQYLVEVSEANFSGLGTLVGFTSSTGGGNGTTTGPNEPVVGLPGDDKDGGTINGTQPTGGVRSNVVALVNGAATKGEVAAPGATDPTADADSELTLDFGFFAPLSLGNRVWDDANNNGAFDAGEAAIVGATVSLLDGAGNPATDGKGNPLATTTNGQGYYLFANLVAGKYVVELTAPAGYVSSTGGTFASGPFEPGASGNLNDRDHGTAQGALFAATKIRSEVVSLAAGTAPTGEPATPGITDAAPDANSNTTIDFGIFRPLSLGNRVWIDANNNGLFDAGEVAPAGPVTVDLLDSLGAKIATTATTAKGWYLFTGLGEGTYRVQIDASNFAAGGPLDGFTSSTGGIGGSGPFEPQAALPGNNKDAGSIVGALGGAGTVASAPVVLAVGKQTVNDEGANGLTPGIADPAVDANSEVTVDFGFFRPLALGNVVYFDRNNNGIQDVGETGLGSVAVNLWTDPNADGVPDVKIAATKTNAGGGYLFTGLGEGKYVVQVDGTTIPVGYYSSTGQNASFGSGPFEPAPSPGNKTDLDDNGTATGAFINSGTVVLTVGGAPTDELATPGIVDLTPNADADLSVDFGFSQPLTIGNLVFEDTNNDGQFSVGEPGLANVAVGLIFDANGNGLPDDAVLKSTATNAQGYYQFTGLNEGTYLVTIAPPAGYISSTGTNGSANGPFEPAAGPDDNKDQFDDGTTVAGSSPLAIRSGPLTLTIGGEPLTEPASPNLIDPATNANSNLTVDFGLFRPQSVGNRVWDDVNNNGKLDAGEAGISAVAVTLFDAVTKVAVAKTLTDANGYYLFPYLTAGKYFAEVAPPAGFVSSTGGVNGSGPFEPAPAASPENNLDGVDDGTQISPTIVRSGTIVLSIGGEPTLETDVGPQSATDPAADGGSNLTLDFGLFRPLSLGNLVFFDKNNNGAFDSATETGIANVTVNLWTDPEGDGIPNVKLATTVTNASGSYLFAGLGAGTYVVQVDNTTLPQGYWLSSSGKNGSITGPSEPAAAPGNKADQVDDGTAKAGLFVLSGPVTLTVGGAPIGEPATPGLTDSARDQDSDVTVDFGFFHPVSLGNRVFVDANNDGLFDAATEAGLAIVPVRLIFDANGNGLADDAVLLSTTTNAAGGYLFTNLNPGTYFVEIDAPAGFLGSTGKNGNATAGPFEPAPAPASNKDLQDHGSLVSGATIRSGAAILTVGGAPVGEPGVAGLPADPVPDASGNYTIDFGLWRPLALGNLVFFDRDNNGVFDPATEAGIAGVPVRLFDAKDVLIGGTTTGADGKYLFANLGAGSYRVEIDAPSGFLSSSGKDGSFAGPYEPAPNDDADDNDNGTATVLGGTTVRSGLVDLLSGTEPTTEDGDADTNLTVDFGLVRSLSLGNFVWDDASNNGVVDTGEVGIPGVGVRLYADVNFDGVPDAGVLAQTTTDANGLYRFDGLLPGGYLVEVADPVGFVPSSGKNGTILSGPFQPAPSPENDVDNDDNGSFATGVVGVVRSGTVKLATGSEPNETGFANLTVDFGYFRPMSLGDLVWNDKNNNGKVDVGEPGLANVPVRLFDGSGVLIASTNTTATGLYLFTNLVEGNYTVEVDLPAGFTSSTGGVGGVGPFEPAPNPNNDVNDDDNGSVTVGQTVKSLPVTLTRGTEPNGAAKNDNFTVDFGAFVPLSLGNRVWFDVNNNGVLDPTETGIANVNVRLFRDANADGIPDGAALASQTTNATGHYLFTGLGEGNFVIEVDPPAGHLTSSGKNGSLIGPSEPSAISNGILDGLDNGSFLTGVVRSNTVTLSVGGEPVGEAATTGFTDPTADSNSNLTVDFGFFRPMSLGNRVFDDRNNDGQQGAAEPGVAGVVVTLLDSTNAVVGTTTTDGTGTYRFDNLVPGNYVVEIQPPAGYVSSTGGANGAGPFEPAPTPNGTRDGFDVGTTQPAGTIRSGPVSLVLDNAPVIDGDTDPNTDLTVDFGIFRPLSLGNLVWNDANNNGLFDAGEVGLGAVTVNLWTDPEGDGVPNSKLGTMATNAQGSYLFTGLGEGTYVVQIDAATLPAGFVTSSGKNGSASGPFEPAPGVGNKTDGDDNGSLNGTLILSGPVALALGTAPLGEPVTPGIADPTPDANSNVTVDFGFYRPLALGNLVWSDFNNDGKVTTGEPGVPNLVVQLFDAKGTAVASTKTDANGNYRFDFLNPNDYYVEVTPPAGVLSSKGAANAYEPGPDPDDNIDNDDNATSTGGPGSIVRSGIVTLAVGQEPNEGGFANLTLDVGLLATAKVSGFVYRDPDFSGTYVPTPGGDSPFGGVTVTISGTDAGGNPVPQRTTTTDSTGFYQFTNLPPGTYVIVETQPGGIYYDGFDTPGTLGGTTPSNDKLRVTLAPNDDGKNYNFGELPPANAFGNVYVDSNRNGRPDPGERPIPGVSITISGTAYAGTSLARPLVASDVPGGSLVAVTNGAGRWEFPSLPPGTYTFAETQPAAFRDAQEQNGDPQTNPVITNDRFAGVSLRPFPVGGPYNFGEIDPNESNGPTKRDFLGTSNGNGVPAVIVPDGNRPVIGLPFNPTFTLTTGTPTVPSLLAVGAGPGSSPVIRVFDFATGGEKFRQFAYESSFTGGVRVATGDVNGDGIEDVVTSTGVGGGPRIRVFSGDDGRVLLDTFVYESTFRGGVFVAVADVNGDGRADIIVGAEVGGGPRVRAIDGGTGAELLNFFAFDSNQRGGVRVAAADFNNDGRADIVATTGVGVTTRVRVINSVNQATLADFAPYEAGYTGGVYVAAGDVNGDGKPDIIVGADQGGGPRVQIFTGTNFSQISNFFAFEPTFTGGVRVATADVNGDAKAEVVVIPGPGGAARTRILRGADFVPLEDFYSFDVQYTGGAYVG